MKKNNTKNFKFILLAFILFLIFSTKSETYCLFKDKTTLNENIKLQTGTIHLKSDKNEIEALIRNAGSLTKRTDILDFKISNEGSLKGKLKFYIKFDKAEISSNKECLDYFKEYYKIKIKINDENIKVFSMNDIINYDSINNDEEYYLDSLGEIILDPKEELEVKFEIGTEKTDMFPWVNVRNKSFEFEIICLETQLGNDSISKGGFCDKVTIDIDGGFRRIPSGNEGLK